MRRQQRGFKLLCLMFIFALLAAACSDDDKTTGAGASGSAAGSGGAPKTVKMTVTINLNPAAKWDDGSDIGVDDFVCSWQAALNTPGSIITAGYDKVLDVKQGADKDEIVVTFFERYAPYKNLFDRLLQKSKVNDCNDISADFTDSLPFSGRPLKQESWSADQQILVKNENYWNPANEAKADRYVMVPKADSDTEVASLKSGESDFIFPQAFSGIREALNDPNIKFQPGFGTNYENLWFSQKEGLPMADPILRKAFVMSLDRDAFFQGIYVPIFSDATPLNCAFWVPTIGDWCENTAFADSFNKADEAAKLLTDNGWAKNGSGLWAKDGNVPKLRWMINSGNKRREDAQALMIPKMRAAGFDVAPDNCDAACVFQQRSPAGDYDIAMYISTAQPDPSVTATAHCDQIPSQANNNKGQNTIYWCNEEASKLMVESDQEIDEAKRAPIIHEIDKLMAEDAISVPLFQFPNIAAVRTDKVTGDTLAEAANYRAFAKNMYTWAPTSGNQIVLGAEQWPECLNPMTECANSSWAVWTVAFQLLPAVFDTTADGNYEITDLVTKEPTVELS